MKKHLDLLIIIISATIFNVFVFALYAKMNTMDWSKFIPEKKVLLEDFKGKDIRIYEVYHKPAAFLASDIVLPIQAGRALNSPHTQELQTLMMGDDTGDNISHKNKTFAELTVLYWIWKNVKADYVGLIHYRRSLRVDENTYFCQDYLCKIGLNHKNIDKLFDEYDIIMPSKYTVFPTLYDQFIESHFVEDIELAFDYIRKKYPEMKDAIEESLMVEDGYFTNMFIMKKEILDEYAEWIFDILFAIEDKLDYNLRETKTKGANYTDENQYQLRAPAYLAERLINVWMYHNKDKYDIGELDVVFRK